MFCSMQDLSLFQNTADLSRNRTFYQSSKQHDAPTHGICQSHHQNINHWLMLKRMLLGLSLAGLLLGCDVKEKERLRAEVDSLKTELQTSNQMAQTLQEVGTLLDSIDASRQLLRTEVLEGTNYSDYAIRLKDLNAYIGETQAKIADLENSVKTTKSSYAGSIKRLKLELEESSQKLAALQEEVEKMRSENQMLAQTVNERDSVLSQKEEVIKVKEQGLAALEQHVEEVSDKARMDQADLYFAQAQALETAADRTKFAPKKKKETQREALELYRMSLSLGKEEAQEKVNQLEEILS